MLEYDLPSDCVLSVSHPHSFSFSFSFLGVHFSLVGPNITRSVKKKSSGKKTTIFSSLYFFKSTKCTLSGSWVMLRWAASAHRAATHGRQAISTATSAAVACGPISAGWQPRQTRQPVTLLGSTAQPQSRSLSSSGPRRAADPTEQVRMAAGKGVW